jgi:hypothetical protein
VQTAKAKGKKIPRERKFIEKTTTQIRRIYHEKFGVVGKLTTNVASMHPEKCYRKSISPIILQTRNSLVIQFPIQHFPESPCSL